MYVNKENHLTGNWRKWSTENMETHIHSDDLGWNDHWAKKDVFHIAYCASLLCRVHNKMCMYMISIQALCSKWDPKIILQVSEVQIELDRRFYNWNCNRWTYGKICFKDFGQAVREEQRQMCVHLKWNWRNSFCALRSNGSFEGDFVFADWSWDVVCVLLYKDRIQVNLWLEAAEVRWVVSLAPISEDGLVWDLGFLSWRLAFLSSGEHSPTCHLALLLLYSTNPCINEDWRQSPVYFIKELSFPCSCLCWTSFSFRSSADWHSVQNQKCINLHQFKSHSTSCFSAPSSLFLALSVLVSYMYGLLLSML